MARSKARPAAADQVIAGIALAADRPFVSGADAAASQGAARDLQLRKRRCRAQICSIAVR